MLCFLAASAIDLFKEGNDVKLRTACIVVEHASSAFCMLVSLTMMTIASIVANYCSLGNEIGSKQSIPWHLLKEQRQKLAGFPHKK